MSDKFTPGPWEVRLRFGHFTTVVGRQRFPICDTATSPSTQANEPREEANARLIAAAPELLSALRSAREICVSAFKDTNMEWDEKAMSTIDSALAKATGAE